MDMLMDKDSTGLSHESCFVTSLLVSGTLDDARPKRFELPTF